MLKFRVLLIALFLMLSTIVYANDIGISLYDYSASHSYLGYSYKSDKALNIDTTSSIFASLNATLGLSYIQNITDDEETAEPCEGWKNTLETWILVKKVNDEKVSEVVSEWGIGAFTVTDKLEVCGLNIATNLSAVNNILEKTSDTIQVPFISNLVAFAAEKGFYTLEAGVAKDWSQNGKNGIKWDVRFGYSLLAPFGK